MSSTELTDERTRSLSRAIFSSIDPGRPVLRLLDPATNELCDYRLVKIPRSTSMSQSHARRSTETSGRRAMAATSAQEPSTGAHPTSSGQLDSPSQLWQGPPSFGTRFASPLTRLPPLSVRSRGDGTPALFNDSRTSDASTPSFGPTPFRQLFPGVARLRLDTPADSPWASGSSARVGLGFSDMHKDDGTPFDGLGSLPRHTSTPHSGSVSPGMADTSFHAHPMEYVNLVHPRATSTPAATDPCSPPSAPARHAIGKRPQSVAAVLPTRPDQDDVFLSCPIRVPGSLTRGLFGRPSSAGGVRGARRGSVATAPGGARRPSWGWTAGEEMAEGLREGGERKPVWKP